MVQSVIQHGFHAGEWAPALYARVDLAKYRAGAALLENFYVDYRGGASSRPGTRYVLQTYGGEDDGIVRLIPFQASVDVGYVLEFGGSYMRVFFEGEPIFDDGDTITGASGATITGSGGADIGDTIFIEGVVGVTDINNRYWIVTGEAGAVLTLTDLFGNSPNFTGYTSGGSYSTVMIIDTPYHDEEIALLKFTQNVDKMYICHPDHPPHVLTLISASEWTLVPIVFGSTMGAVGGLGAATTNAGANHYSYVVTALDVNNQESNASAVVSQTVNNAAAATATINLTWTAVTGATSYNVYRTPGRDGADPPTGSTFGFVMNVTQVAASDIFIAGAPQNLADFSSSVPIPKNPFGPPGVASATITNPGAYTSCPAVTFDPPALGVTAQGSSVLGATSVAVAAGGAGWSVGDTLITTLLQPTVQVVVTSIGGGGVITGADVIGPGAMSAGTTPGNPRTFLGPHGAANFNVTYGVVSISITQNGSGYTSVPNIVFASGAAAATAVLQSDTSGNPTVPGLFQQRLVLAAKPNAVQTFNMSQPGAYYNFDETNPILASDAIEATLVDGQLNKIVSMVSVPTGLIFLTSRANWLVSGSQGPVTPIDIQAHAHSYNGASDVPPIVANFDTLFVQSKGSIVRDLTFNFYTQIYTGTDISVLSSHLFYGHTILEWCWAEEPFKVVWAVRDDGVVLSLTFLKEQELIGWAHSNTDGLFKSTATVTENTESGRVDAVYFVVERIINGNTVKYIERLAERQFPNGAEDAWCVDAGLQYSGPLVSNFSGAEHLVGKTVTGLADGNVITPFVMPASGNFTLLAPASKVTVGLSFEPRLQTLPLDIGEPTIQGKRKGINGVTVRVEDTLGLFIGKDFDTGVAMKDLVVGNVGSATNEIVTNLVTADARTIIDPSWDVPGQYCIKQPNPLPVTVLGVIPEIGVGDTK